MRIRPYKSLDNRIDGAVIALFDINEARKRDETVARARDYAEAIVEAVRQPLLVLDKDLRVQSVNASFSETFGVVPADAKGRSIEELGDGQWKDRGLRGHLQEALRDSESIEDLEIRHSAGSAGPKTLLLRARRIVAGDRQEAMLLVSFEEAASPGRTREKQ